MASIKYQPYKADAHIDAIVKTLRDGGHLLCSNLAASSKAFVVEETFRQIGGQHLIVCADKEDAAYFYNDLESLLGERGMDYSKKQVLFYPTSYKRPYEPEKPDNTYILSRTEVLQRVSTSERKTLIVSYPEALSEKVFTRKLLAKNTFKIKVGDKINLDFLTDLLYDYEFENVDFVVEPGQFAIRGGLVDVFSFANDYPYRIEFFGDEVDSIRSFNIADQLSIEQPTCRNAPSSRTAKPSCNTCPTPPPFGSPTWPSSPRKSTRNTTALWKPSRRCKNRMRK